MAYRAVILKDSVNQNNERLTTLEVDFPRMVLSEFNKHRMLSSGSASSRAIPVKEQLRKVLADPFVPDEFGRNQSGMNPNLDRPLTELEIITASKYWLEARDAAAVQAIKLLIGERALGGLTKDLTGKSWAKTAKRDRFTALCQVVDALPKDLTDPFEVHESLGLTVEELLNIHKQYPNRLLEPFMWHTVIVTATEWDNFFALRTDSNAQREIRLAAVAMREAMGASEPKLINGDEDGIPWHLPLFDFSNPIDLEVAQKSVDDAKLVSIGRCARVSYLTHAGVRDPEKDIELARGLRVNGHMTPFEHVARPLDIAERRRVGQFCGNFRGWVQARKEIPNENNFAEIRAGVGNTN